MTREELIAQDESMRAAPARQGGIMTKNELERLARNHGTGGWQTLDSMIEFGKAILAKADELRAQAESMQNNGASSDATASRNADSGDERPAAPPSAAQPVARVSVQRYKGHNGYENCDWEWNVDIPPDGNYVLYTAPPDLAAKVARLEDALRGMLELAEYWFMRENRRGYSEEQYKAWYSLGFDSNEFKNARAALARGEA